MKAKQISPTPIRIGHLSDKKSLKSKLAKKAARQKRTLHSLIVNTLTESV